MSGQSKSKPRQSAKLLQAHADGTIPLHDANAEALVLGTCMVDQAAIAVCMNDIKPEYFYVPLHASVAEAIRELILDGGKIDQITVVDKLRKLGQLENVGGAMMVSKLTNNVASSVHIGEHMEIVKRHWLSRQLRITGMELMRDGSDAMCDPNEIIENLQTRCMDLGGSVVEDHSVKSSDILPSLLAEIENRTTRQGLVGCPSGYQEIDHVTGGWRPGRVYVLAGRPAMGKTTLAINYAWRAALIYNKRVLFHTLEMSNEELVQKCLAMVTSATNHQIDAGLLEKWEIERLKKSAHRAVSSNLIFDDTAGITPLQLRSSIFKHKQNGGVDLVIVDYLQLMTSGQKTNDENHEYTVISRSLKRIAKEMQVPIIPLSQLSREVEKDRADGRPKLRHLRSSGSIEQDADMVSFVYRPGYYNQKDEYGAVLPDSVAELIIAKHRGGALADIALMALLKCGRFYGRDIANDPSGEHFESERLYLGEQV